LRGLGGVNSDPDDKFSVLDIVLHHLNIFYFKIGLFLKTRTTVDFLNYLNEPTIEGLLSLFIYSISLWFYAAIFKKVVNQDYSSITTLQQKANEIIYLIRVSSNVCRRRRWEDAYRNRILSKKKQSVVFFEGLI
jgi:hypothetical protein